ncbi:MAG TPA: sulfite exporter TauE/SafE family protein [Pseudolabrys sp.]|nr:sulfite exporter TauE/SafE family protein [Pseudolabrys sp.]
MIDPLYSLSGFAVGLLVGMTGVGGGSLMTPILILLFGIHPATAVGTDLLYAAATKTGGSLVHGWARSIDWKVVRRLASGSIPATAITIAALSHFNLNGDAARDLITLVLSVALFATAFVLVFGGPIVALYRARVNELDPKRTATTTVLVGALLGVLVSISSVGAGAIGVVLLVLLYPQLPISKIVGSDIVHAVPLTLIAGIGHWMMGSVDWHIIASLLVGSLPGIFVGSYFAVRVPERALQLILAVTLFVVASRIAYDHATQASSIFTAFSRRAGP